MHALIDALGGGGGSHARGLADDEAAGRGQAADRRGIGDGMALPAADRAGAAQPLAVMLVDEGGEELARLLGEPRIGVADAGIDAVRALRKQPAIEGRDHAVEDHLDMVRLESDALPPAMIAWVRWRRPRSMQNC